MRSTFPGISMFAAACFLTCFAVSLDAQSAFELVSVSPSGEAASQHDPVVLTFNAPVDAATVNEGTVQVRGSLTGLRTASNGQGQHAGARYSVAGDTVTVELLASLLPNECVTVAITNGVMDVYGAALSQPRIHGFRVGAIATAFDFAAQPPQLVGAPYIGAVTGVQFAMGDLNGDGAPDLAQVSGGASTTAGIAFKTLMNDGWGAFLDSTLATYGDIGDSSNSVALGDIDNDGDLDAIAHPTPLGVWLNDGSGVFVPGVRLASLGGPSYGLKRVALEDVDMNGTLDIVSNGFGDSMASLWVNSGGGGAFSHQGIGTVGNSKFTKIDFADLNADGARDLIIHCDTAQVSSTYFWLNDGAGFPGSATTFGAGLETGSYVGDLDEDGIAHRIAAGGTGAGSGAARLRYYPGISGGFADFIVVGERTGFTYGRAMAGGDVNGDGLTDLVIGPWLLFGGGGTPELVLNLGQGQFAQPHYLPSSPVNGGSPDIQMCDVDGDGDLDVMAAFGAKNLLYFNGAPIQPKVAYPTTLPHAADGLPYDVHFTGEHGAQPFQNWRFQGSAPAWLVIDPVTGAMTGNPPAAGTQESFTVAMTDQRGGDAARDLTVRVVHPGITPLSRDFDNGLTAEDSIFTGRRGRVEARDDTANPGNYLLQFDAITETAGVAADGWVLKPTPEGRAVADDPLRWEAECPANVSGIETVVSTGASTALKVRFDWRAATVFWKWYATLAFQVHDGQGWVTQGALYRAPDVGANAMPVMSPASVDVTGLTPNTLLRMRWIALVKYSRDADPAFSTVIELDNISISSTGTTMAVTEGGVGGPAIPYLADAPRACNFGQRDINAGASAPVTITIENTGAADLNLSGLEFGAGDAAEFVLGDASGGAPWASAAVAPGASVAFTVKFDPVSTGHKIVNVKFRHDATNAPSPFYFRVRGEGTDQQLPPPVGSPKIEVSDADGVIVCGSAPLNGRVFDPFEAGAGSGAPLTMTVKNTGTADLALGTPVLSGVSASDFVLDLANYALLIAPKAATSFTVRFKPSAIGLHLATVELPHNGINETNPFTFDVQGEGLGPLELTTAAGLIEDATEGVEGYTMRFMATGGTAPYIWKLKDAAGRINSDILPAGLLFNDGAGVITGRPELGTAGAYAFTLTLTDSKASATVITRDYILRVLPAPLPPADDPFDFARTAGMCSLGAGTSTSAGLILLALVLLALAVRAGGRSFACRL